MTMRCWSPPWKLGRRIDLCFFRKTLLTSVFSVFVGRIVQGFSLALNDQAELRGLKFANLLAS